MLGGKKYTQSFQLFSVVKLEAVNTSYALIDYLDSLSIKSKSTKHWIDNSIKPVMIMMLCSRANQENEWLLHLLAVDAMLPYFRAARCHNYARYASF